MKYTPILCAALCSVSLATPAFSRPMTPEDVARIESVGAIAISPDGAQIAYTTDSLPDVTKGEKDGSATSTLYIAEKAGDATSYLPKDVDPYAIDYSPDGKLLSYLWAKDDEKTAVWGIPVKGGAPRKLAAIKEVSVQRYTWAADGKSLFLIVGAAPDEKRKAEHKKGFDARVYEEEVRFNRLFRANIGKEADKNPAEIPVTGYVTSIIPAPDGISAAFVSTPTWHVDDSYTSSRVHIIDLATGKTRAVVGTKGKLGDVELSADGKTLSLIAGVDISDPAETTLYTADFATGTLKALNEGAAEAAADAQWLDDGRLAAIIQKGVQTRFRIYNGDKYEEYDPGALILSGFDCAATICAIRAHSPKHPNELFAFNLANPAAGFTRWTEHNIWLKDIDFGTQRAIRYTARDGVEIEGVLIEPVGKRPKTGFPTILDVHGGPESHEPNGWQTGYSNPGQVAAGAGYAVFLPNYRGSTGYGTAFSKAHQGDPAGKEFDDLVDAKRALVALGITDPARTGITGGSYGGYASAWGATAHSAEYAASVMFVGISDLISKYGTTDIPHEMHNVHNLAWPWDNYQKALERSPIFHVDKAETPILIMHGDSDTRVSPTQSNELYRNIKLRKPETPVRLVFYPGEGHGNQRAASKYDYNLRMMQWFDTYLKTGNRKATLPPSRPVLVDESEDAAKAKEAEKGSGKKGK